MEAAFDLIALLFGLAALFGYINHTLLKLPHTIGLVIIALAVSLGVLAADTLAPSLALGDSVRGALEQIDFTEALMKGLLAFLLFAGALHVDYSALASHKLVIGAMATLGVLISTGIIALGAWAIFQVVGVSVSFAYCLVFGALISPTDPIAVLSILKHAAVPKSLEAKIAGESLFNDGVGVVVFTILAAIATGAGGVGISPGSAVLLFLAEAVGGAVFGLAMGWIAFLAMRSLDEHNIEVIITLALVSTTYALAHKLHVSGLIAVVVAGLLIGNHGARLAMSDKTREHINSFWSLIDEILNSVLFMLIGFEVIAISFAPNILTAAVLAIPLALIGRFIAVAAPVSLLRRRTAFSPGAIPILTWGGLRGGISVALAQSLPPTPEREILLAACYAVVIFSIIVQGLTMTWVVRRYASGAS